jgi:hypothetical protein
MHCVITHNALISRANLPDFNTSVTRYKTLQTFSVVNTCIFRLKEKHQSLGGFANSKKIKMYTPKLAVNLWTCYILFNLDQIAEFVQHGVRCTTYRYFRSACSIKIKNIHTLMCVNIYLCASSIYTGHTILSATSPCTFLAGKFKRTSLFHSFYCVHSTHYKTD